MIVVCAGAKIVLDLPATREWLETHGVTVVGYGCDELPAFYSRQSGLPIDVRCDTPEEVVRIFKRSVNSDCSRHCWSPFPSLTRPKSNHPALVTPSTMRSRERVTKRLPVAT